MIVQEFPRVDVHVHLYKQGATHNDWSGEEVLDRNFDVQDLAEAMRGTGVAGAVAVQAANQMSETERLLAAARSRSIVGSVVGWLPSEPRDRAQAWDRCGADPLLRGVRHLPDGPNDPWLEAAEANGLPGFLAQHGLTFEVMTFDERGLRSLRTTAELHPELVIVVDHLGSPPLPGAVDDVAAWRTAMASLAQRPNVVVKLSVGLAALRSWPNWDTSTLSARVTELVDLFGPARLAVGSNWPVLLLGSGYWATWRLWDHLLARESAADREQILARTAQRVYGVPNDNVKAEIR